MSFTILFNSRGRVPMLKQMLSRIQNTTYDLDNIEVLINIDDDDTESVNIVEEFEEEFEFVKFLINPRELNIHKHVNIMADMAQGKYIWALGDDCHIMTMHWDKIAKDKLDSYLLDKPDGIVLGAVDSTSVDKEVGKSTGWYCDAPILTSKGRDALGYLIHPHFISLGADVVTFKIYKGVDRIVDLREIVFDHITHNTIEKVINPDQTAAEYRSRQRQHQNVDPHSYNCSSEINILRSVINES